MHTGRVGFIFLFHGFFIKIIGNKIKEVSNIFNCCPDTYFGRKTILDNIINMKWKRIKNKADFEKELWASNGSIHRIIVRLDESNSFGVLNGFGAMPKITDRHPHLSYTGQCSNDI